MLKGKLSRAIRSWEKSRARLAAGRGGTDAVHQLRVLTRNCREGFRLLGYKNEALARFSHSLGPARDVEMLWQRLAEEKNPSLERQRLLDHFDRMAKTQRGILAKQLRSSSAKRLGQSLHETLRRMPSREIDENALAHQALQKALKHLRRLWKDRPKNPGNDYLHPLRRAIRRMRYVSELTAPIGGKRVQKLAEQSTHWQKQLGDYQDALIAQRLLRPIRQPEARRLVKGFRKEETKTAEYFWKKWRRRGWRKMKRQTMKALNAFER